MKPTEKEQRGAIGKVMIFVVAVISAGALWIYFDEDVARRLKQEVEIQSMAVIGDVATKRLASASGEGTHGAAVDLIKRPIEVRKVSENIHYATGVGNTIMITTSEGVVLFDTGLVIQSANQLQILKDTVSDADVRYIILSHSHADHIGGTRFWIDEGTDIIAHQNFEEEQRYLSELQPYQYGRNRTLFPWMPAWDDRPDVALMRYGGIVPTITVDDWETYTFTLGGVEFQVIGAPGAEGADNAVLWLPQQKVLISGDFFGPQFPQFPNIFTMRGEKVRKPVEYIKSLDRLIALNPDVIIPSHLDPTIGAQKIREGMQRIRDAVQYVHDETIAGMNAGKTVNQLMKDIKLPPNLELVQNHGRVDWAVKSIWEYYMGWFRFESTTELYPIPAQDVYADLARMAGSENLITLGNNYLIQGEPVKTLHITEIALADDPQNASALALREQALLELLERAENGLRNDYEIYWLKSQLETTQ
ncbi:MAG: MBL fold metallo-hydrolase [Halioglobus sp.]|jgi:alkyl sulfatase BDS1-like metallo-beta-lactamase superfamily hydrolase|nr:MBL fold metallo-hydrolase [Halioglobus sp.]